MLSSSPFSVAGVYRALFYPVGLRLLALAGLLSLLPPLVASDGSGSLTGTVSNTAVGNLLEGARVEVPAQSLTTLTDKAGRYVLSGLPVGTHELVISYIGLDTVRTQVTVSAGQRATRDFDLTTGIYKLDAFKVTGEREGGAVAITSQRNAPNLKNVVATDSFGNLPNMSAGEVLMRLPGVAGSPTEEGLAYAFSIRGMDASLNTITVDGSRLTTLGTSRAFETQSITGAMFDQMELVKGHTPDKGADSLGGTVNLKTRSALSMKEKRRFNYSLSARIAPSFTDQIPIREEHRSHPMFNFGYQEVFDVFGEQRNLAVSVNAFYSENAVGFFRTDRDFQNTTTQPAFVWSYRTQDNYNNRKQVSMNVKTDYRLSAHTKLSANIIANDNYELMRVRWIVTASTGTQNQSTIPGATTSIVPGFTDRVTEVRAVPTSQIDMNMVGPNHYMVRMRRLDLNAEQEFGPLQLDYTANYARTNLNNGNGEGASFTNRITNIGWILDRSKSDLYPRFVQTAGPDMGNPDNYRPPVNGLTHANGQNDNRLREIRGNARYVIPTATPIIIKAGAQWRETLAQVLTDSRRWSYTGTGPLPSNPNRLENDETKTGRHIPMWDSQSVFTNYHLVKPADWAEDLYFREANRYSTPRTLFETVTAGYLMAQGKFAREGILGNTSYLTGVRTEKTDTSGAGWVLAPRSSARSTAAQQVADPVGSALRDYGNYFRTSEGSYTKSFPSAHLTHDVTRNLKARLSWSTSFGRPAMSNLHPGESANDVAQTVSVNNPALLPQMATNWDSSLDYYFEPVGNFSVGFFKKTITDYIITGINTGKIGTGNNNGYNGDYANYDLFQSINAGTAYVQGWEFSYQQQFTFLPGLLKGLSGSANYTLIDTHGDFGGTNANLKTGQIAGFIPRAANLMLSWRYQNFSTRVLYNRTSDYVVTYSAATLGRNSFRRAMEVVNWGLAYQLRPGFSLTCDISNLFNAPQVLYMGVRSQMQTTIINGTTINLGVNGRF